MALSGNDMRVGTIVEHYYAFDKTTGKESLRDPVRRGVIAKVEEVEGEGNSTIMAKAIAVWVQFKREGGAERIPARELNRVSGPTAKSLAIVRPTVENPDEIMQRSNPSAARRPRVEDEMKLTGPNRKGAVVQG